MDLIVSPKSERNARRENQDVFASFETIYGTLFILADGMGGASQGARAADMAVHRFPEYLNRAHDHGATADEAMIYATKGVNREVHGKAVAANVRMGTTLVAALQSAEGFRVVHLGDSRAYHVQTDRLVRLTRDHSAVQVWMDEGKITEEEARVHPRRSLLTRAIGVADTVDPDVLSEPVRLMPGEGLLLCSDGLSSFARDPEIERAILQTENKRDVAATLVDLAVTRGSDDNITALYVHRPAPEPVRAARSGSSRSISGRSPATSATTTKKTRLQRLIPWLPILAVFALGWLVTHLNFRGRETESSSEEVTEQKNVDPEEVDWVADFPWQSEQCPSSFAEKARMVLGDIDAAAREGILITAAEEAELAEKYDNEIRLALGGSIDSDKDWVDYLERLGNQLLDHVGRTDVTYSFHYVDDSENNAFAMPGGQIFVFRGLLETLENEAQLVFVLAHEIRHVDGHHTVMMEYLMTDMPFSGSGFDAWFRTILDHPFSLPREKEADAFALRVMIKEGYSPFQAVALMERWHRQRGDAQSGGLLREFGDLTGTHPGFDSRACALRNQTVHTLSMSDQAYFYVGETNLEQQITAAETQF